MTAKAACILGLALILAALLHGGIYTAGNDFVINRFTGRYEFVPAFDGDDTDVHVPASLPTLTSRRVAARLKSRQCRR